MSSTNRGAIRNKGDFYPTPRWAIKTILREVDWGQVGSVLEPACGDGRILESICEHKRPITIDYAETNCDTPRDYLSENYPAMWDLIITNPPFSLALEFVAKALREGTSVAMLLRLGFLAGQKRHEFWVSNAPSRLFVLSKRPSFTGAGTDSTDYAWFAWGPAWIRAPGIYVVM